MKIPQIQAHFMRGKAGLKKFLPQKVIPQNIKEKTIKKIIPTAVIAAESLTGLSGHAQQVHKAFWAYGGIEPKKFAIYTPYFPTLKDAPPLLPSVGNANFIPKNKLNKNSMCLRENYKGTVEELDYFIEKLIPKRHGKKDYNPFYGKGQSFIDIGKKYNVNPCVLIAIAMQESGRGTSIAAVKMKNIGGIYLNNKHAKFEHVEECIEIMAKTIDKRIRENCKNINAIGQSGKYCDKSASDLWVKNVVFFLNKM